MEASVDTALLDREFQKMTLDELQQQRSNYRSRIQHLQNEISNLAFNNYRTYADVGRMAEHCKDMLAEINQFMAQVKRQFPQLLNGVEKFRKSLGMLNAEYDTLDEINSINCYVWELLKLPKLMDKCIQAGKYQTAYALTNFAVNVKQSKLIHNPIIKEVTNILIEARHGLLDELFNKFAGPIDLAKSIQVVNNIRKIPYISNTQLHVSILQYRDMYLEKNVLSISSEPDFALRVIEIYRDCMYDTVVLYMAVFPNNADFQRKFISSISSDDSRWERWTGGSQSYILQSWAHRNIERMFGFIRMAEAKSALDIEAMSGKLMSFAFSFGRMGLEFRSLVLHEFSLIIVEAFRRKVNDAVKCLSSLKKLDLVDGDIFESTLSELENEDTDFSSSVASAPLELCVWDDVCVFGNQIIEALNESRHLLAVNYINAMFDVLKEALQALFKWLDDRFPKKAVLKVDSLGEGDKSGDSRSVSPDDSEPKLPVWTKIDEAKVRRAALLLLQHFVPFINQCFFSCFPYEKCGLALFRECLTLERYTEFYLLLSVDLFAQCNNSEFFIQLFEEVSRERPSLVESSLQVEDEKSAQSENNLDDIKERRMKSEMYAHDVQHKDNETEIATDSLEKELVDSLLDGDSSTA